MRKQPWMCAGEHPVLSWFGGGGKTYVGIFCLAKSWYGRGSLPAGLMLQQHGGSVPGPSLGCHRGTGQHRGSRGHWMWRWLIQSCHRVPRVSQGQALPSPCEVLPRAHRGHRGSASPTSVPAPTSLLPMTHRMGTHALRACKAFKLLL